MYSAILILPSGLRVFVGTFDSKCEGEIAVYNTASAMGFRISEYTEEIR